MWAFGPSPPLDSFRVDSLYCGFGETKEALMATSDPEYYAKRAAKSRQMADAAKDPGVRKTHLLMADRYDRRASGGELRSGLVERG